METTCFDEEFLNMDKGGLDSLAPIYDDVLEIVDDKEMRRWNIMSLSQYLEAFYVISRNSGVNVVDDGINKVFFTGLYTSEEFSGIHDRIYIHIKEYSTQPCIYTESEIKGNGELKCLIESTTFDDNFESQFSKDLTIIKNHDLPAIVKPFTKEEFDNIEFKGNSTKDYLRGRYEKLRSRSKNDRKEAHELKVSGNNLLHILIDGYDNFPDFFYRSIWPDIERLPYVHTDTKLEHILDAALNDFPLFEQYQEKLITAINAALSTYKSIDDLPMICYLKNAKRPGRDSLNLLLPVDLLKKGRPDFCLVLGYIDNRTEGHWELRTAISMSEAYADMRALGLAYVEKFKHWW